MIIINTGQTYHGFVEAFVKLNTSNQICFIYTYSLLHVSKCVLKFFPYKGGRLRLKFLIMVEAGSQASVLNFISLPNDSLLLSIDISHIFKLQLKLKCTQNTRVIIASKLVGIFRKRKNSVSQYIYSWSGLSQMDSFGVTKTSRFYCIRTKAKPMFKSGIVYIFILVYNFHYKIFGKI